MNKQQRLILITIVTISSLIFGLSFIERLPSHITTSQLTTSSTAQQASTTTIVATSLATSLRARSSITLPVSHLPRVHILGVTAETHSVVIHYKPIAGAADYRVFDVANPHTVKYAGKVHYDVNCSGTPQVPTCGGQNHFVVDSSGHLVYPYQVSNTGTGPQVVNTINDEIQWNFKHLTGAHILIVQAVNELGPVPPGSLYTPDNQPLYPAMAGMLGSNEGPTPDGNVSINGQGPASDHPQPIAQSQPIVVSPTNAPVLPSASNASQVFFDSFTNAEGATFRRIAYRAQVPSGTADNMEYTLNAGTPQAWTLQYLGADTTDSQPMIDRNHFMDILFDAGTPNISSPLHIAHGVMAMSPDQTADFSGGRVLHVTMEVDAHFSGRRWVGINLAPATDPLINWYTNGGHINTSDQAFFLQFFPGTCDLSIFTGPTSATNPNPTGIDLWGSGLTTPVYCTYARQTIDYGGNGLGLDDRSRFDLFISKTHVALFENGLLLAQSNIPGGLPFTHAKVYFTHYVYHTANDVLDLQNSAPWETYWLHSFPYSDERHWDNLGFEVLPASDVPSDQDFSVFASLLHMPQTVPPTYASLSSTSSTASSSMSTMSMVSTSPQALVSTTAVTSTTSALTSMSSLPTPTATPRACPCSIWNTSAAPATASTNDPNAVELGVKFTADSNGYITGIRFYKGSLNTGTHVGNLWTSAGTLLASATFTNETASGWQQVNFATPIAITANTVYVASYHTNVGEYADSRNYFVSSAVNNPPLHALAGVYSYGTSSSFPNQSYEASNYWVDVVYVASGAVTTTTTTSNAPATVTDLSASPTSVAPGGTQTLSAKVTGSQSLSNATVTFTVLNSADIAVFSASYPGQQLNSSSPETFQAAWMVLSSTPSGSYTLEVTVTSADGSTTYASQQLAGGITIN